MQYQQHNSESSHRSSIPPGSPWREANAPAESTVRSPSGQQNFGHGPGIKLPSLPRLGSQNQQYQRPQQHQPSFAQMVQAQQPHASGNSSSTATKTPDSRNKYTAGRGSRPNSSLSNGTAPRDGSKDTGAQILGSVNAHTMPRVNTSYGMSGLNTVLPGMSSEDRTKAGAAVGASAPAGAAAKQQQQPSDGGAPQSALMQNLSLQDRRTSSSNSAAAQPGQPRQHETERYGLRSLLDVMESSDKEKQTVILGSDMSQSGLDLNSSGERLSHTFASPWQETSKHPVIPDFKLPACYNIDTVVPQQQKLQNFDEGALFYIFYTMPRDAMQEAAAVELTNRSWRYHKELKMWLTKDPLSEPIQTNNQEESGIYIFFDPTSWKKIKREYILYYPDIA